MSCLELEVASRDRIEPSRVLRAVAPAARPQRWGSVQAAWACPVADGLVGHGGPEEAGELAGDGDVDDGRALAVVGEVAVAVVQADLGLPGAIGRAAGPVVGRRGAVAVVPGGLDQQPAGVAVAGLGDVAAVLLVAGGVLAGGDPQPATRARAGGRSARSRRSRRSARARSASRCRGTRVSDLDLVAPSARCAAICSRRASSAASWRSMPSRWIEHLLERELRERVIQALAGDPARGA